MSYCQRKPGYFCISTCSRWWKVGGGISTKLPLSAISDIYLFFHPKTMIIYSAQYWLKSLKFIPSTQFGDGLDIYKWGWPWIKIPLRPNLGEMVLRDQKRKNSFFLSQSIENSKLYNISKNQLLKLIRKVDVRVRPWKRAISLLSPHQIDLGVEIWYVPTLRKDGKCV